MMRRAVTIILVLIAVIAAEPLLACVVAGFSAKSDGAAFYDAYRAAWPNDAQVAATAPAFAPGSDRNCPVVVVLEPGTPFPALDAIKAQRASDFRASITSATDTATTAFGRGFLTACLSTPVYRDACRSSASAVLAAASRSATAALDRDRPRYDKMVCDGIMKQVSSGPPTAPAVSTP